jgi:hypothetical protein
MFLNVGHMLQICGLANTDTVLSAAIVFMVMFISRFSIDEYANRFFADDVFHRVVYFIYTFGVFVMTLNIRGEVPGVEDSSEHTRMRYLIEKDSELGNCEVRTDYAVGFAAGFILTRAALVCLYSMVSYRDRKAAGQFWIYILRHGLSLIVMFALIFNANISFSNTLVVVGAVEIFCAVFLPFVLRLRAVEKYQWYMYTFPLDIYEVQSRLGVFMLMVLGESMIQLLTDSYNTNHTNKTYLFQG